MNLESKFKTALVSAINALGDGHDAVRHEDRYALGLLDLSIKIRGYPHLEAEGKLVPHQKFAPTLRQWVEGESAIAAGGSVAFNRMGSKNQSNVRSSTNGPGRRPGALPGLLAAPTKSTPKH